MEQSQYYNQMLPYAKQVETKTGIPAPLVVSWWSWETAFGTNNGAKNLNNHGGIKSNSLGADYSGGRDAGYKSLSSFANDYARILQLPYYKEVIATAKKNPNDYVSITKAMNKSPYAEQDYNIDTIITRAKSVGGNGDMVFTASSYEKQAEGLDRSNLIKYAAIGLAIVGVVGFMND